MTNNSYNYVQYDIKYLENERKKTVKEKHLLFW